MSRRPLSASLMLLIVGLVLQAGAAEPVAIKMLTYNIHHGEGMDKKLDLPRIAEVIKRTEADLVVLQEVDKATTRSKGVDQAAELGRLTGMHAAFGKAMAYAGGEYGEALLARWPLRDVTVHPLPAPSDHEPRCAISARVRVGEEGPEVLFAGTHLDHMTATVRLCQSEKLNASLAAAGPLPSILAGDLNATPEAPSIKVLLEHWTDASAQQPAPTFSSVEPRVRIDYVFYRPAERWRVVSSRVIDEPMASDHRPLLLTLRLLPADAAPSPAPPQGG